MISDDWSFALAVAVSLVVLGVGKGFTVLSLLFLYC